MSTSDLQTTNSSPITGLRWWHLSQNNSGGYFITNDVVSEDVFVQAETAAEAQERALAIIEDYCEYCECCGQRWYVDFAEDEGTASPEIWEESIYTISPGVFRSECRLHFWDGTVESYTRGTVPQKTII